MEHFPFTLDQSVAVVTMNRGENRFNPAFNGKLLETRDVIEEKTDARTVVFTSEDAKIFSNGIDLEWIIPVMRRGDGEAAERFFRQLNEIYTRLLTCPMITVAAISGHAFAAGAIFAAAFDFRFMRSDRGYFCLPEVDLGIQFMPGMNAILGKAIPSAILEEMQLTGCRLTADDCLEHRIVKGIFPREELLEGALAFARSLNKQRHIAGEMKRRLNREVLEVIEEVDPGYIEARVRQMADA